jgi:alpha-tubulin suppressor-like RCC1 family protein
VDVSRSAVVILDARNTAMRSRTASDAITLAVLAGCGIGCREDAPTAPDGARTSPPALAIGGAPLAFRQVSVGRDHTCGLTTDDRAWCWGSNEALQLGISTERGPDECNTHACSTHPAPVLGNHRFLQLSVGWLFACGVTTDSEIFCWGRNEQRQLGSGDTVSVHPVPVRLAGNRRYLQVAAGGGGGCAITLASEAFCWGANNRGQLGTGTVTTAPSPVPVRVAGSLDWIQLTGGVADFCGVTTGKRAYCWGKNEGALGDGTLLQRSKPTRVATELQFTRIAAGFDHACAVSTTARAYCWGKGFIGDGTTTLSHLTPVPVLGDRSWADISAGGGHGCGVTAFHRGLCWGANGGGQIGDGTRTDRKKPFPLAVDLSLARISAGQTVTCAVTRQNRAYCWGENFSGEVGDGTDDVRTVPTAVLGPI